MRSQRLVALAAVLMLLLPSALAVCGDCNGDGNTSIIDALVAAQHAAVLITLTGQDFLACNVSGAIGPPPTGSVSILDALVVAQFAAGLPVTLKCDEPVWNLNCGAQDTDSLPVATMVNPPDLTIPGGSRFYSLTTPPAAATDLTITLSFAPSADYDLFVGAVGTAPGSTSLASYAFQERFSSPEVVVIDSTTVPSIDDFILAGQPVAIAIHCFNGAGASYTLDVDCTIPLPPSIITVSYGQERTETTIASALPGPDFMVSGSGHWFVLNSFPDSLDHLIFEVEDITGDHDLYVGSPSTVALDPYSAAAYPHRSVTASPVETVIVSRPTLDPYGTGPVVVVVSAATPGEFIFRTWGYTNAYCSLPLSDDITFQTAPSRGALGQVRATRYYELSGVTATTTELNIEVIPITGTGDLDLYVGTTGVGDQNPLNYEFAAETVGQSSETITIDSTTTPPLSSFIGTTSAIAVSAFEADDYNLQITCVGGGTPDPPRDIRCGDTMNGQVTVPSGTSVPPALAMPGTTDFYCLINFPPTTESIQISVDGAAGDQYVLLVGAAGTPCGATTAAWYTLITPPQQDPGALVSVCGNPSLEDYFLTGRIALAVHWVSGGPGDYTIEITCNPGPTFCGTQLRCGDTDTQTLVTPTQQINPTFTEGLDTEFYQLYPVPFGTSSVEIRIQSTDPLADYDLFVGGAATPQCATSSFSYQFSSQNAAPLADTVTVDSGTLTAIGCNPIPIAVYFYDDDQPYGEYTITVTCF